MSASSIKRNRYNWTREIFDAERLRIKSDIEAQNIDDEKAVDQLLAGIRRLNDSVSDRDMLTKLVMIIATLTRLRKLANTPTKIYDSLFEQAAAILQVAAIDRIGSRLSFIWGVLDSLRGQYLRAVGQHMDAAWIAVQCLDEKQFESSTVSQDNAILIEANRLQRAGHIESAAHLYQSIIDDPKSEALTRERALLEQIRCRRFRKDWSTHQNLILSLESQSPQNETLNEIGWEKLLSKIAWQKTIRPLFNEIKGRGEFNQGSYALEGQLWVTASGDTSMIQSLPGIDHVWKKIKFSMKPDRALIKSTAAIVQSYDENISVQLRLEALADAFRLRSIALTIDRELLILAALAPALHQMGYRRLADFCTAEYASLSVKLGAQDGDALSTRTLFTSTKSSKRAVG